MFKVLIVDDDLMARKLMEIFINSSDRYEAVSDLSNPFMTELYCIENKVDLILMDMLTVVNSIGLETVEKIKNEFSNIKIIVITSLPEYSYIDCARKSGADSFWYKEPSAETLLNIMDRTMDGESIYPENPPVVKLGAAFSHDFTKRELEILKEVVNGKTDAAIGEKLHLSVYTIKQYVSKIREKTHFANRTELAVNARASGLVICNPKVEKK